MKHLERAIGEVIVTDHRQAIGAYGDRTVHAQVARLVHRGEGFVAAIAIGIIALGAVALGYEYALGAVVLSAKTTIGAIGLDYQFVVGSLIFAGSIALVIWVLGKVKADRL